ncbi:hypothetical protein AB0M79_28590 [Polymorphospora sp. NPDC051019]|uniref:hypothetical protein n=1 Tax=Polymorphospora sp. NPDC051019 TaxID=3155725 RepID=UPI003434A812
MPTDHTRSAEPGSDQPAIVTDQPLLLGDGRLVAPRHIGGEYSLCELLHEPRNSEPTTTRDGLDHRGFRPVGSLIPVPNTALVDHTATGSSSAYLLALAAAGIPAPATAAASDPLAHHPRQA